MQYFLYCSTAAIKRQQESAGANTRIRQSAFGLRMRDSSESRFRSVKPSRATLHRSVAFDWFDPIPNPPVKRKATPYGVAFFLAEDEGFEPPQTESESGVLPLHKSSMRGTKLIILKLPEKSRDFFKIFQFSSQGNFLPFRTSSFRYRKVFSSPSSRSMVRIYSSSRWVC